MQILAPTALTVLTLKSPTTALRPLIYGRRRGRRRRRPIIGSLKITTSSLIHSLLSLRDLFFSDPSNLLHLVGGGGGGGGDGGGIGFPTGGGFYGEWFGKKRRWGKFKGLIGLLLFSTPLVLTILGVENRKREGLEFGIRVLVPLILGFKIRGWRNPLGILMILAYASFVSLQRRRKCRKPW